MSIEDRARMFAKLWDLSESAEGALIMHFREVRREAFAEAAEKVRMSDSDLEIFRLAERVRVMGQ